MNTMTSHCLNSKKFLNFLKQFLRKTFYNFVPKSPIDTKTGFSKTYLYPIHYKTITFPPEPAQATHSTNKNNKTKCLLFAVLSLSNEFLLSISTRRFDKWRCYADGASELRINVSIFGSHKFFVSK